MPQFSIIVPVYNVEQYLKICVDSVLEQTYNDFELILVDDGSPDNCPAICNEYAKIDSRVHVIHQENRGLSAARNAGLDAAVGKFVCFVDSDDSVKNNLLETVMPYLDGEAELVVFNHERVYPTGEVKPGHHDLGEYSLSQADRISFFTDTLLTYKIGWEVWNRIFRRDIIENHHLRFADSRRIFAEDMYFNLCYCAHINKIVSISHSLYFYTIREDSIMGRNNNLLNIGRMNELGKAVWQHFQEQAECADLLDAFPAIHYLIMDNVVSKSIYKAKNLSEYREIFQHDINDCFFYPKMMRQLLKKPKYLHGHYPASQLATRLSIVKYLLDGNYLTLRIRNKLIHTFQKAIDTINNHKVSISSKA